AALFVSFCPLLIFFGARTMTEMASAPLLVAAAYLLEREKPMPATSGALAALSIYLRYQNGIITVGLLALLWTRKLKPEARRYLMAAAIVGVLGGLLDWVTWKYPFQAFVVYVKFNLID